jgi:hypothetical protein
MQITNRSFLRPVAEELNKNTGKDKKYMIAAITVTTNKFGPSGSLKNKNIVLEHTMEVILRISKEVFFDLKYMFIIILENLLAGLRLRESQI